MATKAISQISIVDLSDGYTVSLSQDSGSFAADSTYTAINNITQFSINISALQGTDALSGIKIGTCTVKNAAGSTISNSITAVPAQGNVSPVTITVYGGTSAYPFSGQIAVVTIPVYIVGDPSNPNVSTDVVINKTFAISAAAHGKNIVSTTYYYLLQNSSAVAPSKPTTNPPTGGWTTVEPTYTSEDINKKLYVTVQTVYDDNSFEYTTPTVSTSYEASKQAYAQAQSAISLAQGINQYFWVLTQSYSETIPSGTYITEIPQDTFKESPASSNLLLQSTGITIRNGVNTLASLSGTALTFYKPGTEYVGLELSQSALNFYNPSSHDIDASLTSTGLILSKGGVTAGESGQSGFVYLSTDPYGSYTINSNTFSDWKQIVGNKFGIRNDGQLYASEVNVSGAITAGEGSNVGSWVINDVSIHSTGKDEWDANIDGIYIGQYVDPELGKTVYTIAGGKTNYSLTGDTKTVEGKKYYQYDYVLSSDSVQDGSKTYYKYIQLTDQYVELTQEELITYGLTEDEEVVQGKVYYTRSETEPYVYTAVENPTGNPHAQGYYEQLLKSPVEQGWYEYIINEVIVPSGESPLDLGLYESAGPTWYINSDGSANFGSLTVNQNGILDVPAASISGALTAGQIEVSDLSAITANIGSTINSELTSNTLEINATNNYEPTNDTRIHPDKFYYKVGTVYIDVENPSGSPKDNGYYESGEIYEEVTPEAGDNPHEEGWYEVVYSTIINPSAEDNPYEEGWYETSYEQVEDPTGNPNEQGWYEYDATNQSYELTLDTIVDTEKIYYIFAGYVLSADTVVSEGKTYYELEYAETIDTQVVSDKVYYIETLGYVKSSDDEVDPTKTYKYIDEDYRIELISGNINPKEEGYFERVVESYIRLNTERSVYDLTNDTEVTDLTKEYYYYLENYFDTKDVIPDPNKIYYRVQINENEIDYIPIPDYNIHSEDNPSENGWYEREAKYDLVRNLTDYYLSEDTEVITGKTYYKKTIVDEEETYIVVTPEEGDNPLEEGWYEKTNPFASYYYELDKIYTAEINLQKGDIVFESNDKPVFSINSEEEDDINVTDVEVLEKIKFGNLELVPYQNGLVIQVGGEQN